MLRYHVAYINQHGARVVLEVRAYSPGQAVFIASCGQYANVREGEAEALPLL